MFPSPFDWLNCSPPSTPVQPDGRSLPDKPSAGAWYTIFANGALLAIQRFCLHLALSPNCLPAHSGPAGRAQIWQEFRQISVVLGFTRESAPGVHLAGAAGSPHTRLGS